jgi:hypothetical protein
LFRNLLLKFNNNVFNLFVAEPFSWAKCEGLVVVFEPLDVSLLVVRRVAVVLDFAVLLVD